MYEIVAGVLVGNSGASLAGAELEWTVTFLTGRRQSNKHHRWGASSAAEDIGALKADEARPK